MSFSASRSTEINLDEFERRLRAAGEQQANFDDPLAELARLVEGTPPPPANAPSPQRIEGNDPTGEFATGALRPELDGPQDYRGEDEILLDELPAAPELDEDQSLAGHEPEKEQPSRSWRLTVAGLAVIGLAMIGGVLALRGGVPGLPKQAPFIAAADGPTKVQPPSEDTVATANDGANLLKDSTQAGHVKVVASEEQPVDLSAQVSPQVSPPAAAASAPGAPAADTSGSSGSPVRGTVDAPVVVATAALPQPAAAQFPDPKPVRTVSLRPDGTPIPSTAAPAETGAAAPAPVAEGAKAPAKQAADAAGIPQPSTPKLELPTKLSPKSSARVLVAKTETTAPAETANEPVQLGAPPKPARTVKTANAQQGGAGPAAAAQPAADPTATATSGGWAVQLAAPKSETEAKSTVARLNDKYASALNGSAIGVHKAVVNGETIYRLRVVGLSKVDAAALCARVKGDGGDCFVAK